MNRIRIKSEFSKHVIEADDGPFIGSTTTMVDFGMHIIKDLSTGNNTPEESFKSAYVKEIYVS